VRFDLPLPAISDIGYYTLTAVGSTASTCVEGTLRIILAPARCYEPAELLHDSRLWGLSVQLYALRSSTNWGVGDFGDLAEWLEWAAKDLGAGMVGLNPMHALKNSHPYHISPYSPDSRLYVNTLYLDMQKIPDLSECVEAQQMVADESFRSRVEALRERETVDYEGVYEAKLKILEALFASFQQRHCRVNGPSLQPRTKRGRAFARYVRKEGEPLALFALFQAISETMRRESPSASVWQDWPEPYRHPDSPAVKAYRESNRVRIRFHQYLQWIAAEQLQRVSRLAAEHGMPIGLYHDLALGSDRTGSDAWMFQDVLALGVACGAPPDAFAPEGQNWGLPPPIPHRLRADGYRMFIELLRKNMAHGGALRLDHVMALFRLFWVPCGLPASAGTYVRYPWEDLLGILALESVLRQAVVVGEDLGTVPDLVREKLAASRVLSYRVFYFERSQNGEWKAPGDYPKEALAVISTHDLPPLAGYWAAQDIELRWKLGLYSDEAAYRAAVDERRREKTQILEALRREGLLLEDSVELGADSSEWTPELSRAVHCYVARTPACLMLVGLEDLIGHRTQINLPGTLDSYPNWSLKFPVTLDALQIDPRPRQLAAALQTIRSHRHGPQSSSS
ncbi:MAG: 4-alpha-glucanotransferase, partial [Nitrospiraceae bacterium]|nr:4-alpha-glucanotransferase [Nitrospiraceae bacterium]